MSEVSCWTSSSKNMNTEALNEFISKTSIPHAGSRKTSSSCSSRTNWWNVTQLNKPALLNSGAWTFPAAKQYVIVTNNWGWHIPSGLDTWVWNIHDWSREFTIRNCSSAFGLMGHIWWCIRLCEFMFLQSVCFRIFVPLRVGSREGAAWTGGSIRGCISLQSFFRLPYHLSRKLILNLMNLSNGLSCCQKISFFWQYFEKMFYYDCSCIFCRLDGAVFVWILVLCSTLSLSEASTLIKEGYLSAITKDLREHPRYWDGMLKGFSLTIQWNIGIHHYVHLWGVRFMATWWLKCSNVWCSFWWFDDKKQLKVSFGIWLWKQVMRLIIWVIAGCSCCGDLTIARQHYAFTQQPMANLHTSS